MGENVLGSLAKLMEVREWSNSQERALYESIYELVNIDLEKVIDDSTFPQKTNLIYEMKRIIEEIEFGVQFPFILGKTVVGVMGNRKNNDFNSLDYLMGKESARRVKICNAVPILIYNDNRETITGLNSIDCPIELTGKEFNDVNKRLYQNDESTNIDIRRLVYMFSMPIEHVKNEIVYAYFPFFSLRNTDIFERLIVLTDCMIIPYDENKNYQSITRDLVKLKYTKQIYITYDRLEEFSVIEEFINSVHKDIIIVALENIKLNEYMKAFNIPRNNFVYAEKIHKCVNDILFYVKNQIRVHEKSLTGINRDLVNLTDEFTKVKIQRYKEELAELLTQEQLIFGKLNSVVNDMLENVHKLEILIRNKLTADIFDDFTEASMVYHENFDELVINIILKLISIEEYQKATHYISVLEARKYEYIFLFDMYKDYSAGKALDDIDLRRLMKGNIKDNLVAKFILLYNEELELSLSVIEQAIQYTKPPYNKEECLVIGDYLYEKNPNMATNFYSKALDMGSIEAGKRLLKLKNDDCYMLEMLADKLIPEANYKLGIINYNKEKYAKGIRHLKIAATLGNVDSVRKVADIEYNYLVCENKKCIDVIKGKKSEIFDENIKNSLEEVKKLYIWLEENIEAEDEIKYRLGIIYYLFKDYLRAREYLSKVNMANGDFILGILYENGYGVAMNLNTARRYYDKASIEGHALAKARITKVDGKIKAQTGNKESSRNTRSYSSERVTSKETDSHIGCFISTAICQMLRKEDDCYELQLLRNYRDTVLIKENDGKQIIEEYYKIAPNLVNEINSLGEAEKVYSEVYSEYLCDIIYLIENKQYLLAKNQYVEMVRKLQLKFEQ